jgi:hypothetical protein
MMDSPSGVGPIKQYPLRKITESKLAKHFGDLDTAVRSELATSLVRQWLTNDGCAGLVTLFPVAECGPTGTYRAASGRKANPAARG